MPHFAPVICRKIFCALLGPAVSPIRSNVPPLVAVEDAVEGGFQTRPSALSPLGRSPFSFRVRLDAEKIRSSVHWLRDTGSSSTLLDCHVEFPPDHVHEKLDLGVAQELAKELAGELKSIRIDEDEGRGHPLAVFLHVGDSLLDDLEAVAGLDLGEDVVREGVASQLRPQGGGVLLVTFDEVKADLGVLEILLRDVCSSSVVRATSGEPSSPVLCLPLPAWVSM